MACIGGTGTDNTTEFEDGQNIHLANGNMDQQQHRDLSPSCQHPVQQQPTDTANVEIFQLPGQRLHYMVSNCSIIDVLTTIGIRSYTILCFCDPGALALASWLP